MTEPARPEWGRYDYYGISDDTDNKIGLKIIYLGNKADHYPDLEEGTIWDFKINGTEDMDDNTESGILKYMTGEQLQLFVGELVFGLKHMEGILDD